MCLTARPNSTRVFRYGRRRRGFEILGQVADKKDACFRPHGMVVVGKTTYVAKTDNPGSGYLWVCGLGRPTGCDNVEPLPPK